MKRYLDNTYTYYPKPIAVADSMYDFMVNKGSKSRRGSYKKGMESDRLVYERRRLIGNYFTYRI